MFLGKLLKKNPVKIINWLYTILAAMIGWVYFRSDNIFQANEYVVQLFSFQKEGASVVSFLSMNAIIVLVVGILFAGFVQRPLKKYYDKIRTKIPVLIVDFTLQFVLFFMSILMLVSGTYNPFIYFQF